MQVGAAVGVGAHVMRLAQVDALPRAQPAARPDEPTVGLHGEGDQLAVARLEEVQPDGLRQPS